MNRYLFQQHQTIEKLRPVIGRPSDHGQNRQLFESVQQELTEQAPEDAKYKLDSERKILKKYHKLYLI